MMKARKKNRYRGWMARFLVCAVCLLPFSMPVTLFARSPVPGIEADSPEDADLFAAIETAAMRGELGPARDGLAYDSGYVRSEAAKVLADYGDQGDIALIEAAVSREGDSEIKDLLLKFQTKLEYRLSPDTRDYVASKLSEFAGAREIPDAAFDFILNRAKVLGEGASILATMLEDPALAPYHESIGSALEIIGVAQGSLWNGINAEEPEVRQWAIRTLASERTAQVWKTANGILINRMLVGRQKDAMDLAYEMERNGVLRAENPIAFFEEGSSMPDGWEVTQRDGENQVEYVSNARESREGSHSFAKYIKVTNASGMTRLQNDWFNLGPLAKTDFLEFGLFFRTGFRRRIIQEDYDTAPVLTLRIEVRLDGGDILSAEVNRNTSGHVPWEELKGRINVDQNKALEARFTITIEGGGNFVAMDDVFVRRPLKGFLNQPPAVTAISASPEILVLDSETEPAAVHPVRLSAAVQDPDGDAVTGFWSSNQQGGLGEGLEMDALLEVPGTHRVLFEPRDSGGFQGSSKGVEVDVRRPNIVLASDRSMGSLVTGNMTLSVESFDYPQEVPFSGTLHIEDIADIPFSELPFQYTLDTRGHPNGSTFAEAVLEAENEGNAGPATLRSNRFSFYVGNETANQPPQFSSAFLSRLEPGNVLKLEVGSHEIPHVVLDPDSPFLLVDLINAPEFMSLEALPEGQGGYVLRIYAAEEGEYENIQIRAEDADFEISESFDLRIRPAAGA